MKKYLVDGEVLGQQPLSQDICVLTVKAPEIAQNAEPGQFVTVRSNHLTVPLLRRPFGVAGVDRDKGTFLIMYRIVGEATKLLAELKAGDKISVMGPLGHGFALTGKHPLLVGGGVGLAPLHFLAANLTVPCDVVVGGRTADELFWTDLFRDKTEHQFETTNDGSRGTKGFVTAVLPELLASKAYDLVYVCGPSPMMHAVSEMVMKAGIPCQISLEKYMGCGLGACLSCTCSGIGKRVKVCKDGPVFWAQEVTEW
jgi:dihydroorotate dehydrogenase electron transfer subunit